MKCQNVIVSNNFENVAPCQNTAKVVLVFGNEEEPTMQKACFTLCMECVPAVKQAQAVFMGRVMVGGYSA